MREKDKPEEVLICRCEEVSRAEIREAVQSGATNLWQVRRLTRAGMGLCQGRSCQHLVARLMAETLEQPIEDVLHPSYRSPIQPVPINTLGSGERIELE